MQLMQTISVKVDYFEQSRLIKFLVYQYPLRYLFLPFIKYTYLMCCSRPDPLWHFAKVKQECAYYTCYPKIADHTVSKYIRTFRLTVVGYYIILIVLYSTRSSSFLVLNSALSQIMESERKLQQTQTSYYQNALLSKMYVE